MENKSENSICPLCSGSSESLGAYKERTFRSCSQCLSVFVSPLDYLSAQEERARYETHNNDVEDPRYQRFVAPLVNAVEASHQPDMVGLDYGCGTGPVAAALLERKGYRVERYDPFFADNLSALDREYDFIVCSEVMEHFKNPKLEFERLRRLLRSGGGLHCMTSLYDPSFDFEGWYYKDDPTHVFFYTRRALEWIRVNVQFSGLEVDGSVISFFE